MRLELLLLCVGVAACGTKNTQPTAGPGQAAQDCKLQDHPRPFIISWDAMERSSLEVQASRQLVFVRYEGCTLSLLEGCQVEGGSYLDPEWAPGKLETIEIQTQNQLMKALPLAASLLGARVSGGESFKAEYFIAGTRRADKDAVSRSELAANQGCSGATHFVHELDLGAFSLRSAKDLEVAASASAASGAEIGGRTSKHQSVSRQSGDLASCTTEDPAAARQCQAPIRLTLRELE